MQDIGCPMLKMRVKHAASVGPVVSNPTGVFVDERSKTSPDGYPSATTPLKQLDEDERKDHSAQPQEKDTTPGEQ